MPPPPRPFKSCLYFQTEFQFHLLLKAFSDPASNPIAIIVTATHMVIYQKLHDGFYFYYFLQQLFYIPHFLNYKNVYISSLPQLLDGIYPYWVARYGSHILYLERLCMQRDFLPHSITSHLLGDIFRKKKSMENCFMKWKMLKIFQENFS